MLWVQILPEQNRVASVVVVLRCFVISLFIMYSVHVHVYMYMYTHHMKLVSKLVRLIQYMQYCMYMHNYMYIAYLIHGQSDDVQLVLEGSTVQDSV